MSPNLARSAPDSHRRRLAEWLAEWHREVALAEDPAPPEMPVPTPDSAPPWVEPYETAAPAEGDLRLVAPGSEEDPPLVVAVLGSAGASRWWVAPFGRLAVPATPGEILLRPSAPGFRVVCLWNARCIPASRLSRSWSVGTLSEAEMEAVQAMAGCIRSGDPVPAPFADRVGPPLLHPMDPRREYELAERRRMDRALPSASQEAPHVLGFPAREAARMAAESPGSYGDPAWFTPEGRAGRLEVWPGPSPASRLLRVVDGQRKPSGGLDGAVVLSGGDSSPYPVVNGWVHLPVTALRAPLYLIHNGQRVGLLPA